jgi:hypothetical protein
MPTAARLASKRARTRHYDVAGLKRAVRQQVLARQERGVIAPQPLPEVDQRVLQRA